MADAIANCIVPREATAAILLKGLEDAAGCLDDAMQKVIACESPEQRKLIAHAIGTVMGMEMLDLHMTLLRQHPVLDHAGLLSARDGPTASESGVLT